MDQTKYDRQLSARRLALAAEVLLTLCIAAAVLVMGLSNLVGEAQQFATEVQTDYDALRSSYATTFRMMVDQIKEKIDQDVSFDEMDAWLQEMDPVFQQAIGADVYDGISLTYKGGYAHSWSYGDYSAYDPETRPWYQGAKAAAGEIAFVAPYVTYLDPSYLSDDEYILMTIAQRLNDEISFDYDLKIGGIAALLATRGFQYQASRVLLYDAQGYILSSNEGAQFAHNILVPDGVISQSMSESVSRGAASLDRLRFAVVDGTWRLMYSRQDGSGNTLCILYPFWEVMAKNFLLITLGTAALLLFECYMFSRNKRTIREFRRRDERMSQICGAAYAEQLHIDMDTMTFSGSRWAEKAARGHAYSAFLPEVLARAATPDVRQALEAFLSPAALKKACLEEEALATRRFAMTVAQGDAQKELIYEVSRLTGLQDGHPVASILVNDVTEDATLLREALQQAEQASRAKGDFMSRMSHEIRTPLNAIIGYIDIARDAQADPEKVDHCLDKAGLASRHLLGIINDVLDISSIESGRMKLAHDEFDLKQMVTTLTTIFYAQAKQKDVKFEVHLEGLESEWLCGDELRVRQILLNLLSNAVKFTPAGGSIYLNIHQVRRDAEKLHLQFQVQDTGIGMSREYMQRMFTPFEQESASTARNYGGTGLGLSISRNLVRMMGGTIHVDSEQGKGTTFTVLLAFDPAKGREQDRLATETFNDLRALVVDDEADTCEYVQKLLARCGVKCDTVTSGKKALRRVQARLDSDHPYDLCIIDWNMQEMDGLATAKEVRRLCGKDLPIIIATGYDYSAIEDQAKAAGVNKIISKPLFQSTLFNLLVNTYGKYQPAPLKEKPKIDFKGLRLILAEDNEMNMEIALDILRKAGLDITPVVNGQEALDAFTGSQPGRFDAILMDVQMPVMDGYTATRRIRESSHPQAKTIPIIAMTANAFTEDVTAALAAGMNDHVAKPISYQRLFDSLSRLTERPETPPQG